MAQAHQNTARVTETTTYGKPQGGEVIPATRRASVRIPSLQQLREVFTTSDRLTDGESEACNRATD